jgi:hypothetical protein
MQELKIPRLSIHYTQHTAQDTELSG